MSHLMRQHVRAREIARRAEPILELLEETEIEVDQSILRTVKGAGRRFRKATR